MRDNKHGYIPMSKEDKLRRLGDYLTYVIFLNYKKIHHLSS